MKLKKEHKKSPKSTKQTCDMGHESKKTTQNTHWNKLWSLIINQPNIEKQSTKKRKKKNKSTSLTRDSSYKIMLTLYKANKKQIIKLNFQSIY
jgi:hypothetical protein